MKNNLFISYFFLLFLFLLLFFLFYCYLNFYKYACVRISKPRLSFSVSSLSNVVPDHARKVMGSEALQGMCPSSCLQFHGLILKVIGDLEIVPVSR